jgi:hypothetical protein
MVPEKSKTKKFVKDAVPHLPLFLNNTHAVTPKKPHVSF